MESLGISENFSESNVEALAVVAFKEDNSTSSSLSELDKLTGGHIAAALRSEEFKGEPGETCLFRISPSGKVKASRILLVGAGSRDDYKLSDICIAAGTATRFLRKSNVNSFASTLVLRRRFGDRSNAVAGAVTSQSNSTIQEKDKKDKAVNKIVVHVSGAKST